MHSRQTLNGMTNVKLLAVLKAIAKERDTADNANDNKKALALSLQLVEVRTLLESRGFEVNYYCNVKTVVKTRQT